MKKNLKLALQASGFVALFVLAAISGIRAETEVKKGTQTKNTKRQNLYKGIARAKDLAKWQEGQSSLQTAYDLLKGNATAITPKSLKDIDAIADDDAQCLELFKVIKGETNTTIISEEDKAIVKKELLEMANYARVKKGQVLELLGEIDKRDSKYLDDDDIREIRHAMSEGSFGSHDKKKDKRGDKKDTDGKHGKKNTDGKHRKYGKKDNDGKHDKKDNDGKHGKHGKKDNDGKHGKHGKKDTDNKHRKHGKKDNDGKHGKKHDKKNKKHDKKQAKETAGEAETPGAFENLQAPIPAATEELSTPIATTTATGDVAQNDITSVAPQAGEAETPGAFENLQAPIPAATELSTPIATSTITGEVVQKDITAVTPQEANDNKPQ